jgi:hypothetical protein
MTAAWLDRVRQRLPALGLSRLGWPDAAARHARVVQALPLGPGSRLLVIEFAGRHLLVGQSRAGLVRLAEGEAP